jgi:hypothetical protein
MAPAYPWVPASALTHAAVATAVTAVARQWAQMWFAHDPTVVATIAADDVQFDGIERCADAGWTVHAAAQDQAALASGLLGGTVVPTTRRDGALCDALADAAYGSLLQLLAGARSPMTQPVPEGPFGMWLSDGQQRWRVRLCCDARAAVALCHAMVQAGHNARPTSVIPIGAMGRALARQQVSLGLSLGMVDLPLGAVRDLAVGDLLLFDRQVTSPLQLAANAQPLPAGHAELVAEEGALHLKITESPHARTH